MRKKRLSLGCWGPVALIGLVVLGASGCGSANRPYPVKGTVLYEDGAPARELAGGSVIFTSEEMHVSASGNIEEYGTDRSTTQKNDDGAPPGKYLVAVVAPEVGADERGGRRNVNVISDRYADPQKSGLTATVEPKDNDIPLTVRRAVQRKR